MNVLDTQATIAHDIAAIHYFFNRCAAVAMSANPPPAKPGNSFLEFMQTENISRSTVERLAKIVEGIKVQETLALPLQAALRNAYVMKR